MQFSSSNPAFTSNAFADFQQRLALEQQTKTVTVMGVTNKTAVLLAIALVAGALAWTGVATGMIPFGLVMPIALANFVVAIGVQIFLARKPQLAKMVAPFYAAFEGLFLGVGSFVIASWASGSSEGAGGLVFLALILTGCVLATMLGLYAAGVIKATKKFKAVIISATAAIMAYYVISFLAVAVFGFSMPTSIGSSSPMISIGFSVVVTLVASFFLILDFDMIEKAVANKAPKEVEWYLAFGLMVTLIWLYWEMLKLVSKITSRD